MPHDDDEIKECESCAYPAKKLKAYRMTRNFTNPEKKQEKMLCILCASTMAGTACEYPEQYHTAHEDQILQAICFVGNAILDAIEELKGDIHAKTD